MVFCRRLRRRFRLWRCNSLGDGLNGRGSRCLNLYLSHFNHFAYRRCHDFRLSHRGFGLLLDRGCCHFRRCCAWLARGSGLRLGFWLCFGFRLRLCFGLRGCFGFRLRLGHCIYVRACFGGLHRCLGFARRTGAFRLLLGGRCLFSFDSYALGWCFGRIHILNGCARARPAAWLRLVRLVALICFRLS